MVTEGIEGRGGFPVPAMVPRAGVQRWVPGQPQPQWPESRATSPSRGPSSLRSQNREYPGAEEAGEEDLSPAASQPGLVPKAKRSSLTSVRGSDPGSIPAV